ncbi:MAG: hypothetical protein SGILL_003216 [Bacillariaceae sp.]
MGNCCCKCTPRWKNDQDIICAYLYEACACFRKRKFILKGVQAGDDSNIWNSPSSQAARQLIEGDVFDPFGVPISIAEEVPTACCGYPMYENAVARLNQEWAPKTNRSLEQYGFEVDGFQWIEFRYVSHGQYGGHTQPVPHFCIRVKRLQTVDDDATERMDSMGIEDGKNLKDI